MRRRASSFVSSQISVPGGYRAVRSLCLGSFQLQKWHSEQTPKLVKKDRLENKSRLGMPCCPRWNYCNCVSPSLPGPSCHGAVCFAFPTHPSSHGVLQGSCKAVHLFSHAVRTTAKCPMVSYGRVTPPLLNKSRLCVNINPGVCQAMSFCSFCCLGGIFNFVFLFAVLHSEKYLAFI